MNGSGMTQFTSRQKETSYLFTQDNMWKVKYTMDTAERTQEVKYPASMKDLLK
jgi:hypothetical protein